MTVRNSVAAFTTALNSAIPADASPLQVDDISGDEVRSLLLDIIETAFDAGVMQGVVLTNGSITSVRLAANAVTAVKIASAAVTAAKLGTGAVTSAKLASGSVTEAKIASNAVTSGKIADDAVDADAIADDAVTTDKIADGNVTGDKLHATIGPFLRTALEGLAANQRLNINDGTQGDLVVSRIPSAIMRNDEFVAELTSHLTAGSNIQITTVGGNRQISATGGSGGGITLQQARNEVATWAQAGDTSEIPAAKLEEVVENLIGAMVTGNTEAGITVGYNDVTGKLNFTVTVREPATWARETSPSGTIPAARISKSVIKDIVGEMVTGNTETGITVTYQPSDDTLDFVVTGGQPAPATHTRYFGRSANTSFSAPEFTSSQGSSSTTDVLTLPTWTGNDYIAFAVPNTTGDITGINIDGLNQIGGFQRVSGTLSINSVAYKVWRSNREVNLSGAMITLTQAS